MMQRRHRKRVWGWRRHFPAVWGLVLGVLPGGGAGEAEDRGGFAGVPVAGWVAPERGEHPRLLFRKGDLAALRAKAETVEGKAILKRLRETLNGGDGTTMPVEFNPERGPVAPQRPEGLDWEPGPGTYTFSHIVGYGMLYQLTGEAHYAELGRQCFELALEGVRDRDRRYSFRDPLGTLRAGPVVGWTAVGYDLCYDGWDEATRARFRAALLDYREPGDRQEITLPLLALGSMPPTSNHYAMQVGGAALVLLALEGEYGPRQLFFENLGRHARLSLERNVTEGFGDGGYFAEGDGTGSMASQIVYLAAVQAGRNAGGIDLVGAAPNVPMTVLKYVYQTVPRGGKLDFWPVRGGYPQNVWSRAGLSGGGYFGMGFGALREEEKAALLWFYQNALAAEDAARGTPYDTISPYPHHAVCAFVNWPVGLKERNPGEVLPRSWVDRKWGFFGTRNRWQDEDDIVITALTRPARGYMGARADGGLMVNGPGEEGHFQWGEGLGEVASWQASEDGSLVLEQVDGTVWVVDFSGASGAEAMLVTTAPAEGTTRVAGGRRLTVQFVGGGDRPELRVEGDTLRAGGQAVRVTAGRLALEVWKAAATGGQDSRR